MARDLEDRLDKALVDGDRADARNAAVLAVACPRCGAAAGAPCAPQKMRLPCKTRDGFHLLRVRAAQKEARHG